MNPISTLRHRIRESASWSVLTLARSRWTKARTGSPEAGEFVLPLSALRTLHILTGRACNQRCRMCYQQDFRRELAPVIWQERLAPLYPHLGQVLLQGGEPTVLRSAWELTELLGRRAPQVRLGIMTNGLRFDDRWQETWMKRGYLVHFSLNAAREDTHGLICGAGRWPVVMGHLAATVARKRRGEGTAEIAASFVILDENLAELAQFIPFCAERGIERVVFFHDQSRLPTDRPRVSEALARAAEEVARLPGLRVEGLDSFAGNALGTPWSPPPCRFPFHNLYVEVTGQAFFCCLLGIPIGDLRFQTLERIWNSPQAISVRSRFAAGERSFCGSYCRPRGKS